MSAWDPALPGRFVEAFDREWHHLAAPGPTLSGSERIGVAAAGRAARRGESPGATPRDRVAAMVSERPASIRPDFVDEIEESVGFAEYVEVVAVCSRLSAVDGVHRALGLELPKLPDPAPGAPTGEVDEMVKKRAAWVPMAPGSIAYALSLVPHEMAAQEELHGPLYLTYEGMADLEYVNGLTRAQMELVAARTSVINECFY